MERGRAFWSGVLLFCLLAGGWAASASAQNDGKILRVKILAFNDFHGHLSRDGLQDKGSAPVLAAYLEDAAKDCPNQTFVVHAGDQVGGSPAASALLKEEPSIRFLNLLAERRSWSLIGTLGNHEFDNGQKELLRLTHRTSAGGADLDSPFFGAKFPYICANVICENTGLPLLPPFVIREVKGVKIAFIGAVTIETPHKVSKASVSGLRFQNEAVAINQQVDLLKKLHPEIKTFIVLLHEGGKQTPAFEKRTKTGDAQVEGRIADIVSRLDDAVDVVISGHTHKFTNALIDTKNHLQNKDHKPILVTQACWHGEDFAEIELKIDRDTKDVVEKWARVIPTSWTKEGPGSQPDPQVSALVKQAEDKVQNRVKGMVKREIKDPVGIARKEINKEESGSKESAMGNLVADADREAGHTQFAFTHLGGMRANRIGKGDVNWRDLFCVQPFRNNLAIVILTGQEIYDVLEQQWAEAKSSGFLQISGLQYTYTDHPPYIVEMRDDAGQAIDKNTYYTVTINGYLADGGDYFTKFRDKGAVDLHVSDFVALINYVNKLPRPFISKIDNRIKKLDLTY